MSRICPLFSGSTGNSTYIGTKSGAVLVDAGASYKSLISAISLVGGTADEIKAVAVTHEHSDHIAGLKAVLNKTGAALVTSPVTYEALTARELIPQKTDVILLDGGETEISGIKIGRFPTSHDCDGSSGFTFLLPDSKKVSVCTDLGILTEQVKSELKGSDLVLLESNHDIEMLKNGPYPPYLKIRIMGDKGHISNNTCASFLPELLNSGTTRFILGHLSRNNNTPLLARSASESALMDLGAQNGKDYLLKVALPDGNGVTVI